MLFLTASCLCASPANAQKLSDGRDAMPDQLSALPPNPLGYPDRTPDLDVSQGFVDPPRGYGNVPFYWWNGDSLDRSRLLWELEQLSAAAVDGFAVSYIHSHPEVDKELNKKGHGAFGKTIEGAPPAFSDEWWNTWSWFAAECAKKGMGVGLDDYTFNWPGNGYYPDEVAKLPELQNYRGQVRFGDPIAVDAGSSYAADIAPDTLAVMAYPESGNALEGKSGLNLLQYAQNGKIQWTAPQGYRWRIVPTLLEKNYMLHPNHGQEVCRAYFQRFEDRADEQGRAGLNFFFQDELHVPLRPWTWAEDFPQQFQARKGYDIVPLLPALNMDLGPITPKVRLDYCDVLMDLVEDRYFRPIFDWHWSRGKIYGCDNNGRGLQPLEYVDYFRAMRWFTAPGNDAPGRGLSFIQTKVSSSVAHLYQRPRVWLEAFHSMGWGSCPEWLTEQFDRHYLFGGNLLCLHGLYYSTHGGWWEWAPPDFHFRMPYWPHMKAWLKYAQRMSYLLSQGRHVCDVAVMYPTSTMQADPQAKPDFAFKLATALFNTGVDFDFIDYQSLARADADNALLKVSNEEYRLLVLPDMAAVRFASLQKALAFYRSGGKVLAAGRLPSASDRIGADDPEIDAILQEIFGLSAAEAATQTETKVNPNPAGGIGIYWVGEPNAIAGGLAKHMALDFLPPNHSGKVLHRRAGFRDVYMVMDVPAGEECFFRAQGRAQQWDAWTGQMQPVEVVRQTPEGTVLRIPANVPRSSLIVFEPGVSENITMVARSEGTPVSIPVEGNWECEFVPTMDNRWGDFRQPPSDEIIGPETRRFRFRTANAVPDGWQKPEFDDSTWPVTTYGFGQEMWRLRVPASVDFDYLITQAQNSGMGAEPFTVGDQKAAWEPYVFSWRWGVEGQPGSQGYHGLKEKVNDGFMVLDGGGRVLFRTTLVVQRAVNAKVLVCEVPPDRILLDGKPLDNLQVHLSQGRHDVLFAYKNGPADEFEASFNYVDSRARSAVVFQIEDAPQEPAGPLAMRWYAQSGRLPYDPFEGPVNVGCYRFLSAPGLKSFTFDVFGEVQVWVDGRDVPVIKEEKRPNGAVPCRVDIDDPLPVARCVAIRVETPSGRSGGAVFPEPIKMTCGPGSIPLGDWSKMGAMEEYSGGMWYRNDISWPAENRGRKALLDLGQVVATCEVRVNGISAGVLLNKPFQADITSLLQPGQNRLEVLVYSTLSNHYQTIPSAYAGTPTAGLLGPVKLLLQPPERK